MWCTKACRSKVKREGTQVNECVKATGGATALQNAQGESFQADSMLKIGKARFGAERVE